MAIIAISRLYWHDKNGREGHGPTWTSARGPGGPPHEDNLNDDRQRGRCLSRGGSVTVESSGDLPEITLRNNRVEF